MNKKRILVMLFVLFSMIIIVQSVGAEGRVFRLAHGSAVDSHFELLAQKFVELLTEESGGALTIMVYPGEQLGAETEVIQNVQGGVIEFTIIGHDPLAQFEPATALLSMPYMYKDHEQAFKVLAGPVGEELENRLKAKKLHILGWSNNGARVYTNNRGPLEKPDDFIGLKLRSPQNPVNLAVTKALGGIPTAITYGEVYTSLQQGTIDGQENSVINIYPAKLYEVQDYMSITNHLLSFTVIVASEDFFKSLSSEEQRIVQRAADGAVAWHRNYVIGLTEDLIEKMKDYGVKVNWPDMDLFKEATRPVYEEYIDKSFSRDLYEKALSATK